MLACCYHSPTHTEETTTNTIVVGSQRPSHRSKKAFSGADPYWRSWSLSGAARRSETTQVALCLAAGRCGWAAKRAFPKRPVKRCNTRRPTPAGSSSAVCWCGDEHDLARSSRWWTLIAIVERNGDERGEFSALDVVFEKTLRRQKIMAKCALCRKLVRIAIVMTMKSWCYLYTLI